MSYIADLHIHSYLSRACSKKLHPEVLYRWCQLKGIHMLVTGDVTHPKWIAELEEKLEPAEPGLFKLKNKWAKEEDALIPETCRARMRFLLGGEISSIYKKNDKVRKVHNLVFAPSFKVAKKINAQLDKIGNLKSDGRPILGLDSKKLLKIVRDTSDEAYLIPAHIWTPHFAVMGSQSGFDSLEECFDELTPEIFAVETGLSSDPFMNWRIGHLDKVALVSNSDAPSPEKLAREANVVDGDFSYQGLFDAIRRKKGKHHTIEFFPEEGKYHEDGHRKCNTRLKPDETIKRKGLCPVCQKPVTVGVLHRIEKLANHPMGRRPKNAPKFENIVPLKEILSEIVGVGPASKRVDRLYHELLMTHGPEFHILRELKTKALKADHPLLALALTRMRKGDAQVEAGYDGEYGRISLLTKEDKEPKDQLALL